jgi:tungstate transport system permease protein
MPAVPNQLWEITSLSLRVSGAAVVLSSAVGIPCGVWLAFSRPKYRRSLSVLVHTGMALPPVVVGLLLYLMLSRSGPLGNLSWLYEPAAMITAQFILSVPFVIGVTAAAVAAVPGELVWQLRSLGATPWQTRLTVLREARAGVALAVATAFGRSISEVGAVMIVGGNVEHHTRVLTTSIVLETRQGHFALALWLSAMLLMIAVLVNVVIVRAQGRLPA